MSTPIVNGRFYLNGLEYYRVGRKYYVDNGTIKQRLSLKEWERAVVDFYLQ